MVRVVFLIKTLRGFPDGSLMITFFRPIVAVLVACSFTLIVMLANDSGSMMLEGASIKP
ncbi:MULTISPECIES: hypothetical protein [Methanococcoides]|uniref:hypothetical protein n=1 Tax=Methanococcoides TaxID=2225 RepID=UPI002033010D|nr:MULTISPECIES: hypothetical protein [Methanococcoides]